MADSRSRTAMATWSISVSRPAPSATFMKRPGRVAAEDGDAVLPDLGSPLGVVDAEAIRGGQAENADLALVEVAVHRQGGVAHLLERVDVGEDGLDHALGDEPVGVPGLAVVGEVAGLDLLQLHPQMPVVVLDHVAAGGRAGDDRAAPGAHEHRGPHGLAARVLEDDVRILAGEGADVLSEPP